MELSKSTSSSSSSSSVPFYSGQSTTISDATASPVTTLQDLCSLFDILPTDDPLETLNEIIELASHLPIDITNAPTLLQPSELSDSSQLELLSEINQSLSQDYHHRREVLLKRMNVTLQSFLWSEKGITHESSIRSKVEERLSHHLPRPWTYSLYDVFAAEKEMSLVTCPTNSLKTRFSKKSQDSAIKQIIIGAVPDRGGRPTEKRGKAHSFRTRASSSTSTSTSSTSSSSSSSLGNSSEEAGGDRGGGGNRGGKEKRPRVQSGWERKNKKGKEEVEAEETETDSGGRSGGGRGGGRGGRGGGGGWGGKGRGGRGGKGK